MRAAWLGQDHCCGACGRVSCRPSGGLLMGLLPLCPSSSAFAFASTSFFILSLHYLLGPGGAPSRSLVLGQCPHSLTGASLPPAHFYLWTPHSSPLHLDFVVKVNHRCILWPLELEPPGPPSTFSVDPSTSPRGSQPLTKSCVELTDFICLSSPTTNFLPNCQAPAFKSLRLI